MVIKGAGNASETSIAEKSCAEGKYTLLTSQLVYSVDAGCCRWEELLPNFYDFPVILSEGGAPLSAFNFAPRDSEFPRVWGQAKLQLCLASHF